MLRLAIEQCLLYSTKNCPFPPNSIIPAPLGTVQLEAGAATGGVERIGWHAAEVLSNPS